MVVPVIKGGKGLPSWGTGPSGAPSGLRNTIADEVEEIIDTVSGSATGSLQKASNLSDLANVITARTNLGFSNTATAISANLTSSVAAVGTTSRTLAARFIEVVNVKDFGAVGDRTANDTAAIQAAIDYQAANSTNWSNTTGVGAIVYFPPGTYRITSTLVLKSFVVLQGASMMGVSLYLSDAANCDMIRTENYATFIGSGKSFLDTGNVPYGFGIRDINLFGNRYNNTTGGGIAVYGSRYEIRNVHISECADFGFVSRRETGGDSFVRNKVKPLESRIDNLLIYYCKGNGMEYYGPTDACIGPVFIGSCEGAVGADIQSSADFGLLHVYDCGKADGSNSPIGVRIKGNSRFQNLISENQNGTGVSVETYYAQIDNLQLYGNCRAYGSYNLDVTPSSYYFSARNVEIRLDSVDAGGVYVAGPYASFGNVAVVGSNYGSINYTKTGFRQASTADYLSVASLTVRDMRGTGARGLELNQGGATKGLQLRGRVVGCTTGYAPGSGMGAGGDVSLTIEKVTSGQAYTSAGVPASTTSRQTVVQIDELGAAALNSNNTIN